MLRGGTLHAPFSCTPSLHLVQFEDVTHASRALADLNGDNLGGLIKAGGIRLSYSKNPLGVRTPTSGGNGTSLQQQQQSPPQADINVAISSQHVLNTRASKGGDLDVVAIPYVFRYLCAELASMGIAVSLEVR